GKAYILNNFGNLLSANRQVVVEAYKNNSDFNNFVADQRLQPVQSGIWDTITNTTGNWLDRTLGKPVAAIDQAVWGGYINPFFDNLLGDYKTLGGLRPGGTMSTLSEQVD